MPTRREILMKARQHATDQREPYCACSHGKRQDYQDDPETATQYDKDTSGIGLNQEPDPLTSRGADNAPVRLKQPEKQRNFLRESWGERLGREPVPGEARTSYARPVNPWRICTASVGRKDQSKYERCIQEIKAKNKIKRD